MTAPTELLPCPWCDGIDISFVRVSNVHGKMRCADCGAYGPGAFSDGDGDDERAPSAIAAWNRRADLAIPAELAGLIEAVDAWNSARVRNADNPDKNHWTARLDGTYVAMLRAVATYAKARAKEGKTNG